MRITKDLDTRSRPLNLAATRETSAQLWERARQLLPGGVASNLHSASNLRTYPIYFDRAKGSRIFGVDGSEYVDLLMAFGPIILGHSHPLVTEAVRNQLEHGVLFGMCSPLEGEVALLINQLVPSMEMVRFASTGTEATMHALRLARAYSGKSKVLKFEGHFHGNHDQVLVSVTPPLSVAGTEADPVRIPVGSGIPEEHYHNTLVAVWNDLDAVERVIRRHQNELAAVISEPLMANKGCIVAQPGFLKGLAEICRAYDVLFILDEVITGFRLAPGGAQEVYGIRPDLTCLAKALGNGMPIAAFGGRREIMELLSDGGVRQGGTYNGSALALAAAKATLEFIKADGGALYERMETIGDRLATGLVAQFQRAGIAALAQRERSMFQVYFTGARSIRNYREAAANADFGLFTRYANGLLDNGVLIHHDGFEHCFLSAAHTDDDVDWVLNASQRVIDEIVAGRR